MKKSEVELVVEMTIEKFFRRQELESARTKEEWLPTAEAAKIIGLSPYRLRMLKDKFEHRKAGEFQSGRLLFKKSSLLENYIR